MSEPGLFLAGVGAGNATRPPPVPAVLPAPALLQTPALNGLNLNKLHFQLSRSWEHARDESRLPQHWN